jgi:hypothetical protein
MKKEKKKKRERECTKGSFLKSSRNCRTSRVPSSSGLSVRGRFAPCTADVRVASLLGHRDLATMEMRRVVRS